MEGQAPNDIEVTGALARAGVEVAKGLTDRKIGKGYIGLQDGAPQAAFDAARTCRRITSSRVSVDAAIKQAIDACLVEKNKEKFAGNTLLVVAPLGSSPNRSSEDMRQAHMGKAQALPFSQVHVTDVARGSVVMDLK